MEALAKKFQGLACFAFVYTQEHHANRAFVPPRESSLRPIPALKRTANREERAQRTRQFRNQFKNSIRLFLVDEDGDEEFTRVQSAYEARNVARIIVVDQTRRIAWNKMGNESAQLEECLKSLIENSFTVLNPSQRP